jgi:hypothetical protein
MWYGVSWLPYHQLKLFCRQGKQRQPKQTGTIVSEASESLGPSQTLRRPDFCSSAPTWLRNPSPPPEPAVEIPVHFGSTIATEPAVEWVVHFAPHFDMPRTVFRWTPNPRAMRRRPHPLLCRERIASCKLTFRTLVMPQCKRPDALK